jgi:hypothetical protein
LKAYALAAQQGLVLWRLCCLPREHSTRLFNLGALHRPSSASLGKSRKLAWYQHFSYGSLLFLSMYLFSALRQFMWAKQSCNSRNGFREMRAIIYEKKPTISSLLGSAK